MAFPPRRPVPRLRRPPPLYQYSSHQDLAGQIRPSKPTQVKPFVLTLAVALACYGI